MQSFEEFGSLLNSIPRTHFDRKHPPLNTQAAQDKLESLATSIEFIETRLQFADRETFPSSDTYRNWRSRATSALSYMRQERSFLEGWMRVQGSGDNTRTELVGLTKSAKKLVLETQSQKLFDEALSLSRSIGKIYLPRYSSKLAPNGLPAAKSQRDHLLLLKQEIMAGLTEVTALAASNAAKTEVLRRAKAPLLQLLSKVDMEFAIVKSYIRNNTSSQDWMTVCVQALLRAVAEGFELTSIENELIERLKIHIKQK